LIGTPVTGTMTTSTTRITTTTTTTDTGGCPNGWIPLGFNRCAFINNVMQAFLPANDACQSSINFNSHLLSLNNTFDNQRIADSLNDASIDVAWIGLNNLTDSGWQWMDNASAEYLRWCPSSPSSSIGDDCVLYYANQTCWRNTQCSLRYDSICGMSLPS